MSCANKKVHSEGNKRVSSLEQIGFPLSLDIVHELWHKNYEYLIDIHMPMRSIL